MLILDKFSKTLRGGSVDATDRVKTYPSEDMETYNFLVAAGFTPRVAADVNAQRLVAERNMDGRHPIG